MSDAVFANVSQAGFRIFLEFGATEGRNHRSFWRHIEDRGPIRTAPRASAFSATHDLTAVFSFVEKKEGLFRNEAATAVLFLLASLAFD